MTTTSNHLNETALERELRFIDYHILRLELHQAEYEALQYELENDDTDEDRRHEIYIVMTDLEIELVLLSACVDRKSVLEGYRGQRA